MPPVQAGSPLPIVGQQALKFGVYGPHIDSGTTQNFYNAGPPTLVVVTGIDFTATLANPVQCFFAAKYLFNSGTTGPTFYYDSQSTGQGNGVWFSWRGAIVCQLHDGIQIVMLSGSNITWAGYISAVIVG